MIVDRSIIFWMLINYWMCWIDKFERIQQIEIIDSLLRVRESEMIKSRDRSSKAENRRRLTKNVKNLYIDLKMKSYIDMKMKQVTSIAKKRAFENSTLRQFSQFERVQMKTMMLNEMNSKTTFVVHRADSISSRRRRRNKERNKERKRSRERERRERKQAISK
jgi:hypothetical protein